MRYILQLVTFNHPNTYYWNEDSQEWQANQKDATHWYEKDSAMSERDYVHCHIPHVPGLLSIKEVE
jgi:hypothetical protein